MKVKIFTVILVAALILISAPMAAFAALPYATMSNSAGVPVGATIISAMTPTTWNGFVDKVNLLPYQRVLGIADITPPDGVTEGYVNFVMPFGYKSADIYELKDGNWVKLDTLYNSSNNLASAYVEFDSTAPTTIAQVQTAAPAYLNWNQVATYPTWAQPALPSWLEYPSYTAWAQPPYVMNRFAYDLYPPSPYPYYTY